MRTLAIGSAALMVGLMVAPSVDAEVKSGLQKGTPAPFFLVNDCTGPKQGTKLCYR